MSTPKRTKQPTRMSFAGKMAGAVDPGAVAIISERLASSGLAVDHIKTLTIAKDERVFAALDRSGPRGIADRFLLTLGDELDEIEHARWELQQGHVIMVIPVAGEDEKHLVRVILQEYGGHSIQYFGRWTGTSIDKR